MQSDDAKRPVQVTREQLYKQVWKTPISRLASEYGISDQGLSKICRRLEVPYPPRGYWAKKANGKPVVEYRLPPPTVECPGLVTITPTPLSLKVLAKPKEARSKDSGPSGAESKLIVPRRLRQTHPIIAGWIDDHESRRRNAIETYDPLTREHRVPGKLTELENRRHRILDTLFKDLEKQGCAIKEGKQKRLSVVVCGQSIDFRLREKRRQVRKPYSKEEMEWRVFSERKWRQVLEPTGRLLFSIDTYLGVRSQKNWLERGTRTMEDMLPDIISTLLAAGPVLAQQAAEQERERLLRIENQRKLAEEQERRRIEEARWERLTKLAVNWREAQIVREFVETLKAQPVGNDDPIADRTAAEWIAWAEARIEATDPLKKGAKSVLKSVSDAGRYRH